MQILSTGCFPTNAKVSIVYYIAVIL